MADQYTYEDPYGFKITGDEGLAKSVATVASISSLGLSRWFGASLSKQKRSPYCPPCPAPDYNYFRAEATRLAENVCYKIPGVRTVPTRGTIWMRSLLTSRPMGMTARV